ncbi:permease [Caloranaerobacter azorensis H53214]|uniref:Predicted permease n=2 Tax=Caloranaerobacter azorensis TaxID=116090 RepID=A0A1M5TQ26_9FIRM|nr:permease [Caloranaerobacter azorensis]KGG81504.1 permease [Caloranaerobacter azorensis H53214]SHH52791.1 Predicted permease [Caloranaerobacter azorensis DSM 13643]
MDLFTILLWFITIILFIVFLGKDKKKTISSMKMAKNLMKNMIGEIIAVLFLIGLILTFIPPHIIKDFMGNSKVILSTIVSALIGSITLIPAFVAFPLVGSLVDRGASIIPIASFLTTLTMVGIVTFPLEKKNFGTKFAVIRNVLSFVFALFISFLMGVLI